MSIMNVAIALAIVFATANAVPYSKFGRSCQDIGCRSDEKCVMAEQPCSYGHQRDQCGRYPTCQRLNTGGESCTTKICNTGQYCRTENGQPTCVNTNAGLAFDSAGISSVNGQKLSSNQQPAVPPESYGTRYANGNPYANANAPPAEEVLGNRYNNQSPASSSNNYPPYPVNNNNMNGYPPYPSSNNNYTPHSGNSNNVYPASTGNNNPYPAHTPYNNNNGYPSYANNPKLNPGWNNVYPNNAYPRRNGANANGLSALLALAISIVGCLRIIKA